MSNNLQQYDDGFQDSFSSERLVKGTLLGWTDAKHWRDRDGLPPPVQLLVVGVTTALQRWRDGKPEVIRDKPLPSEDDLNAAIPLNEWETGVDGRPHPPWSHVVVVYFVDQVKGGVFTFISATKGAHIAYDNLQEAVSTMRRLRGDNKVVPLVTLAERPMKTQFGSKSRPHFEIAGWKATGAAAVPAGPALEAMGDVKPVTMAETVEEEIPY
jgi:hypothetical protein